MTGDGNAVMLESVLSISSDLGFVPCILVQSDDCGWFAKDEAGRKEALPVPKLASRRRHTSPGEAKPWLPVLSR